jgi:hypothetical protein
MVATLEIALLLHVPTVLSLEKFADFRRPHLIAIKCRVFDSITAKPHFSQWLWSHVVIMTPGYNFKGCFLSVALRQD